MSELSRWVSDELHTLLGFSDGTTVQYLVALARKAKGTQGLIDAMKTVDVPIDARARAFAAELYRRVPGRGRHRAGCA